MRLSHDNLLTHFLGKVPYTSWLFTIYKKILEILVGNFGSVKTVRVVHHLPKISRLSRRASRLDSSYKMTLVRNSRNLMHQSLGAAPSSPPGYCGPFARFVSPGGGAFANFVLPGGRAFANPGAIPELLTHAVSYHSITTQRILLGKKAEQIDSPAKDREKLKRVVRACS